MINVGKRVGIVGGLGPETSSKFCLELNQRVLAHTNCQPDLVLENVPVSRNLEHSMIRGKASSQMLHLLRRAITSLNNTQTDFIVIPCNTVHIFIKDLRKISAVPIISIIEECAKKCQELKFSKVGLLATRKTIKSGLFKMEFEAKDITLLTPSLVDQQVITTIILRILHGKAGVKEAKQLLEIIIKLKQQGAEAVIVGCTDLSLVLSEKDSILPLVDTYKILQEVTVKQILHR